MNLEGLEIWRRNRWLVFIFVWLSGLTSSPAVQNTVVMWGSRTQAEVPADATNLASVATSSTGCVGVGRDGTLHPWGYTGGPLPAAATNAFAVAMQSKPAVLRRDGAVVYSTGVVPGVANAVAVAAAASYGAGALRQDGVFTGWDSLWSPANGTSNIVALITGGGYASIDILYADGTVSAYGVPQAYRSTLSNVVAIAKNGSLTVWLRGDGTVAAYPATNTPAGLSNVIAIAAGGGHAVALKSDGTVKAWGNNSYGQTDVPVGLSGVVAIAAGGGHSLALKSDGTVTAWGQNNVGQINVPAGLTNVAAIFANAGYSVALVGASPPALLSQLPDEAVWGGQPATFTLNAVGSPPMRFQWQRNGEIIPDATNSFYRIDQATAADAGIYNLIVSNARGIAASREARLNVRGYPLFLTQPTNQSRIFGDSATLRVTVSSETTLSYQWCLNGTRLSGATQANLVLSDLSPDSVGDYRCVVSNTLSVITSSVAQLSVVLPVVPTNKPSWIGGRMDFAATNAGSRPISWQWFTPNGPVAGATTAVLTLTNLTLAQADEYWVVATASFGSCTSAPVRLAVHGVALWGGGPAPATDLPTVAALGAGWNHYFVERADGTPVVWGTYYSGTADVPAGVPAGVSNIIALAGGSGHSVALLADGTVTAWGRPIYGVTNVPAGLSNVVAVAAGAYHCMALGADGYVRTWGGGHDSLQVPPGFSNVVSISAGGDHCLALRSDGTVVAWGQNYQGQTNVPPGLRDVVAIAAGTGHSLALRADGTLVAWGDNVYGQANVPPGISNVVAIAAGHNHNLALRSDGTVASWGSNLFGENDLPTDLSGVVAIAAGGYHNLAIVQPGLATTPVHIAGVARAPGVFSLQVPTVRAKAYYLQYRDSLADPRWTLLPPVPGDGGINTLSDTHAAPLQRYYRVWQKP